MEIAHQLGLSNVLNENWGSASNELHKHTYMSESTPVPLEQTGASRSLEQYAAEVRQHVQALDKAVDVSVDKHGIRPAIRELQAAVRERYGAGHLIIAGEQTIMPLPKNVAKLVAGQALRVLSDEFRVVNLRANLDLVGSEADMYKVWIPSETSQDGHVDMTFISRARLAKSPGIIAEGVLLDQTDLHRAMNEFSSVHIPSAYGGLHIKNETLVPDFDPSVIDTFKQCYGLPALEAAAQAYRLPYPQPLTLAQGHENYYAVVQQILGIEPDIHVLESDLDPYLLRNGGYELLARVWKDLQNEAIDRACALRTMKPTLDDPRTPFNVARNGMRLFTLQDGDYVCVVDPKTKDVLERHHISEVLAQDSDFDISMRAIPRVIVYSLAGVAGHITGGGSLYNYDAKQLMEMLHMPYFPLWNFDSSASSPIQYMSVASYKTRGKPRQNTRATIDFVRAGKASALDCIMSTYPDQVAEEIQAWIEINAGSIDQYSRLPITNKAGQSAGDYV